MILKLSELRGVACTKFAKESVKTSDFVDTEFEKLIAHSITRWLSLILACQGCFKRTQLRIYTSSPFTSQLMFWNVFLEIIWAKLIWDIKIFAIVSGCFNEQVQTIEKSKASFVEDRKSKNILWQT